MTIFRRRRGSDLPVHLLPVRNVYCRDHAANFPFFSTARFDPIPMPEGIMGKGMGTDMTSLNES